VTDSPQHSRPQSRLLSQAASAQSSSEKLAYLSRALTLDPSHTLTGLQYHETLYFAPNETGTHFLNCVRKPEGDISDEAHHFLQELWNQAYSGLKAFIENDIKQGKVSVGE
jgi:hypothetical protein